MTEEEREKAFTEYLIRFDFLRNNGLSRQAAVDLLQEERNGLPEECKEEWEKWCKEVDEGVKRMDEDLVELQAESQLKHLKKFVGDPQ